jgi:hypothetical protein
MSVFSGAPLKGRALALTKNIRLGWKGLPGAYTLAYYENPLNTSIKNYSTGPGIKECMTCNKSGLYK